MSSTVVARVHASCRAFLAEKAREEEGEEEEGLQGAEKGGFGARVGPDSALDQFAKALAEFEGGRDWIRSGVDAPSFRLPLKFDSLESEIDVLAVLALVNIGSGFRRELHNPHLEDAATRGAAETMQFGVLGMALGSSLDGGNESLSALRTDALAAASLQDVSAHFQLPLTVDAEVIPGVRKEVAHPLRDLADNVRFCLADTGRVLRGRMLRGLGEFVLRVVEEKPNSAVAVVDALVGAFPAFRDVYDGALSAASALPAGGEGETEGDVPEGNASGRDVLVLKKAQLLAADLHRHLRGRDARFDFAKDIGELSALSDNVLPAVLREVGVLEVDDRLAKKITDGVPLKRGSREEIALRAATVCACDALAGLVSDMVGERVPPVALDLYLWKLGKTDRFRALPRHATKDTVYY